MGSLAHSDEELRPIGVLSCICLRNWSKPTSLDETEMKIYHGQQERLRVLHGERLVFEFLAVDRFPPSAYGGDEIIIFELNSRTHRFPL